MHQLLFFILCISFVIQMFYFFYFYLRVLKNKKQKNKNYKEYPISIIISAKNEAHNILKFLPKILNQDYNTFEVIVINDASEDNTLQVLNNFSEQYTNLSIINIKKSSSAKGKKNALQKGIESSKYKYLLFTDADCYPTSNQWAKQIMLAFNKNTEIVLGFGGYENRKGFLNRLINFDTIFIALKYMSFAKAGFPYMGVGRNLAYKKSTFIKNNGFNSHKHILSGDDDLFIKEVANKNNTEIVISNNSKTKSIPNKTWKTFIAQKRRHLTTGVKYKVIHKFLLGTEVFSQLIFYISTILSLATQSAVYESITLYFIRLIILSILIYFFSKKINEKNNIIFIPIFEVLIPIINLFTAISNLFIKRRVW